MFKTIDHFDSSAIGSMAADRQISSVGAASTEPRPTALFADADPQYRETYDWLLRSYGFEVTVAGTGLECLERLYHRVPDLLVLDMEMPWGGGEGVLWAIRGEPWLLPGRVVLTRSRESACGREERRRPAWVRRLYKPFSLWGLMQLASIEELIAGLLNPPTRLLESARRHECKQGVGGLCSCCAIGPRS